MATSCTVAYSVTTDWGTGFDGSIQITNQGDPINGWQLGFSFPGSQKVTNGWNGIWTQTDNAVTVKDAGYNASLPENASTTVGFSATYTGSNVAPKDFTLNGNACSTAAAPAAVAAPVGHAPGKHAAR